MYTTVKYKDSANRQCVLLCFECCGTSCHCHKDKACHAEEAVKDTSRGHQTFQETRWCNVIAPNSLTK